MTLEVYLLPEHVGRNSISGRSAVAIDVLRASTSIVSAIEGNAVGIHPRCTIEEARSAASQLSAVGTSSVLLGGERGGVLIEGFDLDNSPTSYRTENVSGRQIVFTTTNGTRAIQACKAAELTLVGAFVNLRAVCDRLRSNGRPVTLVCAGTDGKPSGEDLLFAGAVCQSLLETPHGEDSPYSDLTRWNTPAKSVWQMWRAAQRRLQRGTSLATILEETQGGKNLMALGLQDDIRFASNIDRSTVVPFLDRATGSIRSDVDLAALHR